MRDSYDYIAHIARQIMVEPENNDPNLITGKETRDCWLDRRANHFTSTKNQKGNAMITGDKL
jgi:hypothetical protein